MEINGYTDNIGTTLANRKLSLRRAGRVKEYLVSCGVDSARFKLFGKAKQTLWQATILPKAATKTAVLR